LVARAIHFNGKRKSAPFVVVNCASILVNYLKVNCSVMKKGLSRGPCTKDWEIELAKGGSIFLDEIGEMECHFRQNITCYPTKELIVLEETKLLTDVRIISATKGI